jgi:acetylornithine/succinyldiaminopimelate/putrescine aminotransferase/predicted amino acid dehydrogenase
MHECDAEQRMKAEKRALLAELLRSQSSTPEAARPGSELPPIIPLSSIRNWRANEQHPYVRYVAPYKGFLYQLLALDKTFVRGEGCYLVDAEGTRYADFIAQYGALPFGHNPEPIWSALETVRREAQPNLVITSVSASAGELAERLISVAPPGLGHVVFTNSGAEAVEAGIKLARCRTGRFGVLSARDGFHGLTLAGMSATDSEYFQRGFGAPAPGFSYVPFGDFNALESALNTRPDYFAAFLLEPIQGESGIHVAPAGYLKAALDLCRRFGVLMMLDEVQTGLGRTGRMFACEAEGITPDILALAKALGGGLIPIGACLYKREVYDENFDLRHGSTFAGNTMACRAALATIDELTKDEGRLVRHVAVIGKYLQKQLQQLQIEYPSFVVDIRGRGLMLGLELNLEQIGKTREGIVAVLQQQNMLLQIAVSFLLNVEHVRITTSFTHGPVLRIEPPLIADAAVCGQLIKALRRLLDILHRGDAGQLLGHLISNAAPLSPCRCALPKRQLPASFASLPREENDGERMRFAFIAHLLSIADMRRFDPTLESFSDRDLEGFQSRIAQFVKPFPLDALAVRSNDGRVTQGELIMLPYLPSEIVSLPPHDALDLVQSAVDLAAKRGAQVIGLGGFNSIISEGGLALRAPAGVNLTSGNSFTAWAAMRAIETACADRGLDLANCTVAIIGAAGAIGHALSLLCAERMAKLILIGNPRAGEGSIGKLRTLAGECERHVTALAAAGRSFVSGSFAQRLILRKSRPADPACETDCGAIVTNDLDRYLCTAHIVFTATNAVLPFISPRNIGKNAVVCDVSRPFNITSDLADERPDVQIVSGGLVRAPEDSQLGLLEERDRPKVLVACAAETMLLSLSGYRSTNLCGRPDMATIAEMARLAEKTGFAAVI